MSGSSFVVGNDQRQLFAVGSDSFTVRDVIDAAHFRGELEPVWEELQRLLACERRAIDEEREADEAAVDTAAQAFRYDHDLITAEETERWLAERGLTLSDFSEYFSRHYWGEAMRDRDLSPQAPVSYLSAPSELRELLIAELMLSGELGRMATRLSWRVAAAAGGEAGPPAEMVEAARGEFIERIAPMSPAEWSAKAGRDEAWIDKMSLLEANFRNHCERALTLQARQRELGSLRLQLTMVELEVIEFDSRDAASEALFCVRDDAMTMEEVATEGRYPFHREELLLEDINAEMQQQFLSATVGEVLEPMEVEGSYRLCWIVARSEPNPEDAVVRARVERRLLERHFADVVSKHVRWEILFA